MVSVFWDLSGARQCAAGGPGGRRSLGSSEEREGETDRQTTCRMLNQVCCCVKESVWTAPDTYGSSRVIAGGVFEWTGWVGE